MEKYFEQADRSALRSPSRNNHLVYPGLAMALLSQTSIAGRQEMRVLWRSSAAAALPAARGVAQHLLHVFVLSEEKRLRFPPLFWRSESRNAYNYNGSNTTLPELHDREGLSHHQFIPPGSTADGYHWGWRVGPAALHRNCLKKDSPTAHTSQNMPREHKQTRCQMVTVPAPTWTAEWWRLWQLREVMHRTVPPTAKQRNAFWNHLAKNSHSQLHVILWSYVASTW